MRRMIAALALLACASAGPTSAQVVLKLASNANHATPAVVGDQVAWEWLKEAIEERTDGEVSLNIYWGGALGSEASLVQSLRSGSIDMLPNSGSNIAPMVPEIGLFSASYLFRDFDHFKEVVSDDRFFDRLSQIVEEKDLGFRLVGIGATGSRNLYNRVRVIETPEDAKGLKMRVQASPVEFKIWSTLGMLPSQIPSTEIYMALQSGVVDAAESSIPFIASNKYYEVAPYISLTNHQISSHFHFLSDAAYEKIPEQHRETVLEAMREASIVQIEATKRLSEEMLDTLRNQSGATVTDVSQEAFAEPLASIQDEVAEELEVMDLLEMIRAR